MKNFLENQISAKEQMTLTGGKDYIIIEDQVIYRTKSSSTKEYIIIEDEVLYKTAKNNNYIVIEDQVIL